jgi:site-specific recombinase XerD
MNWVIKRTKLLKDHEVARLVKLCKEKADLDLLRCRRRGVVDWMAIHLALGAGLRVSEIAGLKSIDCFIGRGESELCVLGKGKKQRVIAIDQQLRKHLRDFVHWKQNVGEGASEYLLLSERREPYRISGLEKRFKKLAWLAGLPTHYSIHCLRHVYGTTVYRATKDLRLTQHLLGHSNPQVTTQYSHLVDEDIRSGINAFSELAKKLHFTIQSDLSAPHLPK